MPSQVRAGLWMFCTCTFICDPGYAGLPRERVETDVRCVHWCAYLVLPNQYPAVKEQFFMTVLLRIFTAAYPPRFTRYSIVSCCRWLLLTSAP